MGLIGSLILLGIVIFLIALFVAQPLTRRRRQEVLGSQPLSALLAERDRILDSLKELDFDNSLGKIPAETYPVQRLSLVQQGADILCKIDQLTPVTDAAPAEAAGKADPVEAILSARRATRSAGAVSDKDEEVESLVASRRKIRQGSSGKFCSHCGRPLSTSDRFCPACGQPVQ